MTNLEKRAIVGSDTVLQIGVVTWPIIIVDPHTEYFGSQQRLNIDPFLEQDWEEFQK
jgi:hypothetical protein